MAEIIWTETAAEDIERISEYISADSEQHAVQFIKRLWDKIELLRSFPEMGRILPELNDPHYREILYNNYRVVYHAQNDNVTIMLITHGSYDITQRIV